LRRSASPFAQHRKRECLRSAGGHNGCCEPSCCEASCACEPSCCASSCAPLQLLDGLCNMLKCARPAAAPSCCAANVLRCRTSCCAAEPCCALSQLLCGDNCCEPSCCARAAGPLPPARCLRACSVHKSCANRAAAASRAAVANQPVAAETKHAPSSNPSARSAKPA